MARTLPLLPTSLVGSYAQPEWLIDRGKLAGRFPPRVRATELWRVAPEHLEEAQNDATLLAIRDQERAGLDIITDGEMRRESYSNRFATALDGVDIDNPGEALDRSGHPNPVPRITGKIRRKHAAPHVRAEDEDPVLSAVRALCAERSVTVHLGSLIVREGDRWCNRGYLLANFIQQRLHISAISLILKVQAIIEKRELKLSDHRHCRLEVTRIDQLCQHVSRECFLGTVMLRNNR